MKPDSVVLFVHFFKKYEVAIVIGAIAIFSLVLFFYHAFSGHLCCLNTKQAGWVL
jgi:hypothetical protein